PNVAVTDDALVQCVGEIRQAMGQASQKLIRTVPRRGYILDAPVVRLDRWVPPAAFASAPAAAHAREIRETEDATGDLEFSRRLSIAVMPFINLSGDPAQEYVADALTQNLITDLARIRDS